MLRTVAAHYATLQVHLKRHSSQTIIDSLTMADAESCGAVRAAFPRVEREPRRRIENAWRPPIISRKLGIARLHWGLWSGMMISGRRSGCMRFFHASASPF